GRTVVTGTGDGMARVWDAHSGKPLSPPLESQDYVRTVAVAPDGKVIFVVNDYWLNAYSWDGHQAVPQSSQLLHGFWKGGFRFPTNCKGCLEVILGDTGSSFHLETLNPDVPNDPPIQGDPKELLEKWQQRLGLKFDENMYLVPRYGLE